MPGRPRSSTTTSGCCLAASVERLLAGLGEVDLVATRAEVDRQRAPDLRLVVDDEDRRARRRRHRTAPPGDRQRDARPSRRRPACPRSRARPSIASTKPRATARPSPTPSPLGLSPSRWNGRKTCSRWSTGIPGPRRRPSARRGRRSRRRTRGPARSAGEACSALPMTLATARSSSAGVGRDARERLGNVDRRRAPLASPRPCERARHDLVEADVAPAPARARRSGGGSCRGGCRPACRAGRSPRRWPRGAPRRSRRASATSGWSRLVDRRLDRRERCAQIVRDRGEQRGAQLVRLGEPLGSRGLGAQPAPLDGERELTRERRQRVEVDRPRAPGRHTASVVSASSGTLTCASSGRAGTGAPALLSTRQPSRRRGEARPRRRTPNASRRPAISAGTGSCSLSERAAEPRQRLGFGLRLRGLAAPSGRVARRARRRHRRRRRTRSSAMRLSR